MENYKFPLTLLQTKKGASNYVCSPFCIKRGLAIIANGAAGPAKTELLHSLGIDDLTEYNKEQMDYNHTAGALNASVELKVLKTDSDGVLNNKFRETVSRFYNTNISEIVSENGKPAVELKSNMTFGAEWKKEYHLKLNKKQTLLFTNTDGSTCSPWFLEGGCDAHSVSGQLFLALNSNDSSELRLPYYQSGAITAVTLEYASNDSEDTYQMIFVLSDSLIEEYDLEDIIKSSVVERMKIKIPVFNLKIDKDDLKDSLRTAGIRNMFDRVESTLTSILEKSVYVEIAEQASEIKVDEKGTEAHSSFRAFMPMTIGMDSIPEPLPEFFVDRPFYFFLRNTRTNEIVMEGNVGQLVDVDGNINSHGTEK